MQGYAAVLFASVSMLRYVKICDAALFEKVVKIFWFLRLIWEANQLFDLTQRQDGLPYAYEFEDPFNTRLRRKI